MGNILKSQMAFTHRLHNQGELQEKRSKVIWNKYERGRDLENTVNIKGDDLNGFDILLLSNSDMSDQGNYFWETDWWNCVLLCMWKLAKAGLFFLLEVNRMLVSNKALYVAIIPKTREFPSIFTLLALYSVTIWPQCQGYICLTCLDHFDWTSTFQSPRDDIELPNLPAMA